MAEVVLTREYYHPEIAIARVIYVIFGVIQTLLALRLLLKLLAASPASQFVSWYYGFTERLVSPFVGALPSFAIGPFTIETATVLAMFMYAITAWLVIRLFTTLFSTT